MSEFKTNLGPVTAYADAVKQGYKGTREEFGRVMANFADTAAKVAEQAKAVEASKEVVDAMQQNVTQMDAQVTANAATVAGNMKTTTDAAAAAEVSKQGSEAARQSVEQTVSAFDDHVAEKTTEAQNAVKGAEDDAVKVVTDQQAASVQAVKDQTAAYIQQKETEAENTIKTYTDGQVQQANADMAAAKAALDTSILNANNMDDALEDTFLRASSENVNLGTTITEAGLKKIELGLSINDAVQKKSDLDNTNTAAVENKSALDGANATAVTNKSALDEGNDTAAANIGTLEGENTRAETNAPLLDAKNVTAEANIRDLTDANFNAQEILIGVDDIKAYLGYPDEDIVGIQVDYKNKTFQRLAGAYNKSGGVDFDEFVMFGGRKRCTLSDDGNVTAWYGDEGYTEDGSNGQVMVYQPKFWYKVVPLILEPQTDGIGYHLRKANYYVSSKEKPGFKLHPVFKDENDNELDFVFLSAVEGSIFDVSAGAYLLRDEQVGDFTAGTGDKFCSIAGAKPASGLTQNLTRPNIEQMARNRGEGWHGNLIKAESANQLLMIIEMGMMNLQTAIAQGVVSIPDNSEFNCSSITGSTSSLGNGTGRAEETINEINGIETVYNTDGKTAVTYRGVENPWGNIWKFVYGVNIWGDGTMKGGVPYICKDFNFAESKNSDNYESAGFTIANANGYISAMGYSEEFDWLFFPSETLGNSTLPVGDYLYISANLNGYRIVLLGGYCSDGGLAGGFDWYVTNGVGIRYRDIGGRLVYIPAKDSEAYAAVLSAWQNKMVAA